MKSGNTNTEMDVKTQPTCVDVRVFLHVRLLVESFAAVLAGVGSRVAVDEQVRGEGARALKTFAALFTLKGFSFAVVVVV